MLFCSIGYAQDPLLCDREKDKERQRQRASVASRHESELGLWLESWENEKGKIGQWLQVHDRRSDRGFGGVEMGLPVI